MEGIGLLHTYIGIRALTHTNGDAACRSKRRAEISSRNDKQYKGVGGVGGC